MKVKNFKSIIIFGALFSCLFDVFGQIPAGYYNTAAGSGYVLKTQLHSIINNHTAVTYGDLWTSYYYTDRDTDRDTDGTILDMYSENPSGADSYNFTYATDQCGSYAAESDCYNREHSFPKSWFNDANPMYTDIFHIVPTDGYVNGQRSNFPYGETNSPTWTSQNGSKKGPARAGLGYSGTVFEPIDEYKGDFARIYFYMATRYEDVITTWPGSDMLDGSSDKVFTTWALTMLLDWHANDPVSQKEIDRNNYIYYNIQVNRNPFVDNPTYANDIWGGSSSSYCTVNVYESICAGDGYSWNGNTLSSQGQYADTVGGFSCDTIKTLHLTVNNPVYTTLPTVTVCDGAVGYIFGNPQTVPGVYQQILTAISNGCDSIISQTLIAQNNSSSSDTVRICGGTFQFGSQVLSSSGVYTRTIAASNGCDSAITLYLTIESIDATIEQNGAILASQESGAEHQWLDCQDAFAPIQGETGQTFSPSADGYYAVDITLTDCKDTSACYQYTAGTTSINEKTLNHLSIFPNPVTDKLYIRGIEENELVEVVDMFGSVVKQATGSSIDVGNIEAGLYYVRITDTNQQMKRAVFIKK